LNGGTLNINDNMPAPLNVPLIIAKPKNAVKNKKKNRLRNTFNE
jgi:hypothetical protein